METFTHEFWAYFDSDSFGLNQLQHILSCNFGHETNTNNGLSDLIEPNYQRRFGIFYDADVVPTGRVYYMISGDDTDFPSGGGHQYVDGFSLNQTWVHYAYVRDGNNVRLFINGN